MGTTRDTLGTADDGGVTLEIDRPRTYNDLDENEKKRFDADIQANNILYDEFERFKMTPGENITDYYVKFHNLVNDMRNIKMTMPNIQLNSKFLNNMTPEWDRGDKIKIRGTLLGEKMLLMQAQENGAVLDKEELLFLTGEQANTYDADTLMMNPLLKPFSWQTFPQQCPHFNKLVLLMYQFYLSADMSNSNVIPYEQYVKHNEESIVPSGASSVQYDDYMLHENNAYIPDDSFTTTLNIYEDQVAIYEQHAKIELTDREQKMDDQIHMLIQELIPNENVIPKVLVCNKYAIDVEPIPPSQRNKRNVQQGYLNRLKDSLDTLCEIVEEARSNRTSNNILEYACVYTKTSQELLENVITSCPKKVNKRDRYTDSTHAKRNKHVTFPEPLKTLPNNTSTQVKQLNEPKINVPAIPSTRVNSVTKASRSQHEAIQRLIGP
nr:retrovirus-related Pol polyprotein from transposon TNT 1-94 [Tanacetum cinerariifolium]